MGTHDPASRAREDDPRTLAISALLERLAPRGRRRVVGYIVALVGSGVLTAAFYPIRDNTTALSKGFGFLVVVVAAAALGGLGPGVVASVLGFIVFNYFFLPPYGTFRISRAEDIVVLFVFLGLSILISALLARATGRADAAEAREAELAILQELGRELVRQSPGEETYAAALKQLIDVFGFKAASLLLPNADTKGLEESVVVGAEPGTIDTRWDPARAARAPERIPLSVGRRNLGLIVLVGDRSPLSPSESSVLRAFCDQVALVLERDRLLRVAGEAELYRQTDEIRRSMLGAVSHELRSPLAAIKASVTDLLAADAPTDFAYVKENLEAVNCEADRLDALIANLLDMTRIQAGSLQAHIQAVDLSEPLQSCVDRTERMWPRLHFTLSVPDEVALVHADPVFVERVATNLLENAAKASAAKATAIDVRAQREGDRTVVRVIDHGPGVPETAREQIFYPFYRLDERNPRLGPGIGLAIVKGFLMAMDGEIWIEETSGGGATFAFSLPSAR
ncbi:MAG: ATP-binding protein [Actinomycetota bacterium]